MHFSIQ